MEELKRYVSYAKVAHVKYAKMASKQAWYTKMHGLKATLED